MEHQHIWDKTLNPDEQVKFEFAIGKKYRTFGLVSLVIFGLLFLLSGAWPIALFFIAFGAFYFGFYLKVANAYAFTDRRVLVHRGWLSTKMITTEYQKITDVTIEERFLDRILFKTGSIGIDTAGRKGEEIVLKHIERPYELKKKLDELRGHL
jgi:uncharacterized membrane protein YdbT with pleckstrin-like domain